MVGFYRIRIDCDDCDDTSRVEACRRDDSLTGAFFSMLICRYVEIEIE